MHAILVFRFAVATTGKKTFDIFFEENSHVQVYTTRFRKCAQLILTKCLLLSS